MAYNADNEIREDLGLFDKNSRGDKVAVTKITNKKTGNVAYDIRNMYTNDDDEIKPTTKGVRLNSELIVDVVGALLKGLSEDERQDLLQILDDVDEEIDEADYLEEDDEEVEE